MLDLDETLIHSHHDGVVRPTVKPGTPPDFILKVSEALVYSGNIFRVILGTKIAVQSLSLLFSAFYINGQVTIDRHPVRFFVHKRPHVDFFLSVVGFFQVKIQLVK